MNQQILIIDDEEKLRNLLAKIISLEGFSVTQASDIKTGLRILEQNDIDVVICDVKLPDGNGVELAAKIKEKYPAIEVIMLTAYGNIPDSVIAIKNGAFDYITKGDDNNRIIPLIYRASEKVRLSKRVLQLENQLGKRYSFSSILGTSSQIETAIEAAKKVAATDTTILLTGETGTGKEVFAQAIHNNSTRSKFNFIALNCAGFSKELLENELFGHKAGAFTGAVKETKGVFEEANGGTVFLDELGELPFDLQARLLRVLETGEFLKIGDSKTTQANVRIIAATNRELKNEITNGNFREDLFYRVSVFQIALPPLRERISDIDELTNYFVGFFANKTNKKITGVSKTFIDALKRHHWKGNIRELKNVIERSIILSDQELLQPETLPSEFMQSISGVKDSNQMSAFDLASAEKIHIQKVLNYTNGNKTEAAKLLHIALTTLYRKIEDFKIS